MPSWAFGPWQPDQAPRLNDGILRTADGVYPMVDGYRPVGQWVQSFSALPLPIKGGASFTSPQGVSSIIAGTATSLYKAQSGGWLRLKDGYSLQGEGRWRFAQFGGLAIATNGADSLQKINLASSLVEPLGGNPPKFETLAVVKDFLVGGVMNGDIMTLGWCGINNAEWWTFGQRQSDYNIMPSGGRINGILSGEFGVILQRNRICRMDYVGGNVIFEINEVSSTVGCVSVHTVAQWGSLGFFWSDEGPMMWDGSGPVPIGTEQVNRFIRDNYDNTDWPNMSTAIDPVNSVVMWSMSDRIILYNWVLKRWATVPFSSQIIFSGVTKAITLDEQDPAVGALDDNVDGVGLVSFDSANFKGGDPRLYVTSSGNAVGTFTGTPMVATFTGGDLEMYPAQRADLRFARPDCDAVSGMTLTLGARQRLGDALVSSAFNTLVASGDMPLRFSGRYIRPTLGIAAGTTWTYAKGVVFEGQAGAGR